jgi:16S rRNA processing protein RimM
MNKDQCFELGVVVKSHGLNGEVSIKLDTDYPEAYDEMESVLLEQKGRLIPFFIESYSRNREFAIVKFEDINSREQADTLKGCRLFLPDEDLPELPDDQFYFHEVKGYTIVDEQEGTLGVIREIYDVTAQALIAMDWKGKEVLIPINDDIVGRIDRDKQELHVNLPGGLLDLYLEE